MLFEIKCWDLFYFIKFLFVYIYFNFRHFMDLNNVLYSISVIYLLKPKFYFFIL